MDAAEQEALTSAELTPAAVVLLAAGGATGIRRLGAGGSVEEFFGPRGDDASALLRAMNDCRGDCCCGAALAAAS